MTSEVAAGTRGQWSRAGSASARLGSLATRWTLPVVVCLLWEFAARAADSPFVPPISEIIVQIYENWFSAPLAEGVVTEEFWRDVVGSMRRLVLGYLLGSLIGIAAGFAVGLLRSFAQYVDPLIHFLRSIPMSALVPLFVLIFGIGDSMKVALIATAVTFPTLINTVDGVRSVDPVQLSTARIYNVTVWSRIFHVILPAASPSIIAGLRISLAIAFVLLIIGEMSASVDGLGYQVSQAQDTFQLNDMWATLFLIGIIAYLFSVIFERFEKRVLHWYKRNE